MTFSPHQSTDPVVRILLLEDDALDAELVARSLEAALPSQVVVVSDRESFMAALTEYRPDVVLADYGVPAFSGPEALSAARAIDDLLPFIYVSGTIGEERAVESLRTGATDYILKGQLARLPAAADRALRESNETRERRAAEQALRESEERLRRILENAQDIVYRCQLWPEVRLEYVSPAVERVIGLTFEELTARGDLGLGLVPEEDRALLPSGRSEVDGPREVELHVRRPDGSYRCLEVRSLPVRDETGRVVATEGIARDVTERKAASELLERNVVSQRRLADLSRFALSNDIQRTCEEAVLLLSGLLHADMAGVFRSDADGMVLAAGSDWPESEYGDVIDLSQAPAHLVHMEHLDGDGSTFAEALVRRLGGVSATARRLAAGDEVLGAVVLGWAEPRALDEDERNLVEVTCDILAHSIKRALAEQRLRKSIRDLRVVDEQRQRLLSRLVSAQEEERRRIAADVHDDSIQIMTAVALRLEMLGDVVQAQDAEEFEELADVVRRSIERLRRLMFALRPPQLDREGLAVALRLYVDATSEPSGPAYALHNEMDEEPPEEVRALLYRIAQEGLTNVRKHAAASEVRVTIFGDDSGCGVRIEDDGAGFEPGELPHDHLGLVAMRERAELAGGRFQIESTVGAGTTVEAWVPRKERVMA